MNNKSLLIYRVTTGLFSLLIAMGAMMYFVQHEMVVEAFTKLGYPTYLIYPLAVAKLLGLVAIWTNKSETLKEWAYAGFVFDLILAAAAHIAIADGEYAPSLVALVLVLVSYVYHHKVYERVS